MLIAYHISMMVFRGRVMGGAHNFRRAVTIYITFAFEKNQHRYVCI